MQKLLNRPKDRALLSCSLSHCGKLHGTTPNLHSGICWPISNRFCRSSFLLPNIFRSLITRGVILIGLINKTPWWGLYVFAQGWPTRPQRLMQSVGELRAFGEMTKPSFTIAQIKVWSWCVKTYFKRTKARYCILRIITRTVLLWWLCA